MTQGRFLIDNEMEVQQLDRHDLMVFCYGILVCFFARSCESDYCLCHHALVSAEQDHAAPADLILSPLHPEHHHQFDLHSHTTPCCCHNSLKHDGTKLELKQKANIKASLLSGKFYHISYGFFTASYLCQESLHKAASRSQRPEAQSLLANQDLSRC